MRYIRTISSGTPTMEVRPTSTDISVEADHRSSHVISYLFVDVLELRGCGFSAIKSASDPDWTLMQ